MKTVPSQEIAIHTHDRNLMVVAGAGSGKTYVLVNRYLALLDANPDWPLNALVAITFTRKAAQEMRDRVRQELEKRYHGTQEESVREGWGSRIASMDSARIDTIHSLCASILRANAAAVGIDPRFDVLDEVEAERLLSDTIETVLQTIGSTNDPAARLFTHYEVYTIRKSLEDLIDSDLDNLPFDLMEHWAQQWQGEHRAIVESASDPRLLSIIREWSSAAYVRGADKLADMWLDCQEMVASFDAQDRLEARIQCLQELHSRIKFNVGKAGYFGGAEGLEAAKAPLRQVKDALALLLARAGSPPGEIDQRVAEVLPLWHRLITHVQVAYRMAKTRDALVDFDDLERLTRDLLQRRPEVRKRYQQTEFKHLLVDEFQDTNTRQWAIVRALADPVQPGSLFIVGDGKQSIYQFRGADVSVFNHARQEIHGAGGEMVSLVRSFRTHRPLVTGFNHLFKQLLTRDESSIARDYQIVFEDEMEAERENPPGDWPALEVLLVNRAEYKGAENILEQCRRWEAHEIANRLHHMIHVEKRPMYDKREGQIRPMEYGDVALLFRAMSDVNLYEDVFKAAGMPFITVSGRGYYNRQEVWDLINLLTALHNPADNLRLASALRSPLFNLSDDALLALRLPIEDQRERPLLWNALQDSSRVPAAEVGLVEFARNCLYDLRTLAGRVTVAELLREALARSGYMATLTSLPDGARRRGNVEKLLDKAQTSGHVTLGAFSQYLRDMSASEVHEGEALVDVKDSVTLMTIHGSKGLEFPLVVLVDMSRAPALDGSSAVIFTPHYGLTCKIRDEEADAMVGGYAHTQAEKLQKLRDEAERKRLLYVAATRAQDYLLISGTASPAKEESDSGEPIWKSTGWMQTIFDALQPNGFVAGWGESIREFDGWGQVSLIVPEQPPDQDVLTGNRGDGASLWDQAAVRDGQPLSNEIAEPLLLRPVHVDPGSIARHLTATQIRDLGSSEFDSLSGDKFRRSVLHDAPSPVEEVSNRKQTVSLRIIGEMVHEALGWWRFPTEHDTLESVLKSYAWELGVVDYGQQQYAIQEARKLLQRTMGSDVYQWLESAQNVYREIPFVFQSNRRTVHGILDVLFQRANGTWGVIDYKTSFVPDYKGGRLDVLRNHARRFHLQVGVYAAAVKEQLGGITPDVYIHYIRYGETIPVYAGEWELALGKIESHIGNLLDESDWVT